MCSHRQPFCMYKLVAFQPVVHTREGIWIGPAGVKKADSGVYE